MPYEQYNQQNSAMQNVACEYQVSGLYFRFPFVLSKLLTVILFPVNPNIFSPMHNDSAIPTRVLKPETENFQNNLKQISDH